MWWTGTVLGSGGTASRIHDLGYDIIRYFSFDSDPVLIAIRKAVDAEFGRDMNRHCSRRGVFTRYTCHAWEITCFAGVQVNSFREGYRLTK